jgi:hypothetical protein
MGLKSSRVRNRSENKSSDFRLRLHQRSETHLYEVRPRKIIAAFI